MAAAAVPTKARRRRLSARRATSRHAAVDSLDKVVDRRLCAEVEDEEAKGAFGMELVGKGAYGKVYASGLQLAVKRIEQPAPSDMLRSSELPADLRQLFQLFSAYSKQGDLTTEEFTALLASTYGIGPHIYRISTCPNADYRLLIMERWDSTFEQDVTAATTCGGIDVRPPILPWFDHPLRIWRDLTLTVLQLAAFGIVHRDIHDSNIVVRRNPVSGQPQIALIDFGAAKILSSYGRHSRQALIEVADRYKRLFENWEIQQYFDVPLTNNAIMQTAIDQFTHFNANYYYSPDMQDVQLELQNWWRESAPKIVACTFAKRSAAGLPHPVPVV